ncbi:TonB-dependent receptor domain-containing protein [Rariglobus hedericola]|uniref:TonB-dependent receptor n=1 Tax=Rariglobus hedericola TaxID=2597822 RepID=A0A556QKH4_9BACT|nr:TonB-dependent receptor [Rariglobus hedericola]TSJ77155.1 TonB-dependent receptor [Rariglobus hedericola]
MNPSSFSSSRDLPSTAASDCPMGFGSFAKTLAFMSPLMMIGSLGAQEAAPAPANTDAQKNTKPSDVVELPAVTVEATAAPKLSSPKFTQPLLDTPQTVVVVPKEIFNQQGATTLSDVLRNTPGITFTAGENGNVASGDTFTMRGFDSSGSIFVDGTRDTGAFSRDVFNIEQVEIAKGPAGADNGRGGSSGYVNLATKSPSLQNFTTAALSYGLSEGGGDPQSRAAIDTNIALDKSPVPGTAFRLNLMAQDSGVPGRDYVENTSTGVAPSFAFGLGTPTRLILSGSYVKQDNRPDSGLPAAFLPGNPLGATLPSGPVDQSNFYGTKADYEDVTSLGFTARIEHDLTPDNRITNQTRYAKTDRKAMTTYIGPNPYTAPNVFARRIINESENKIFSNQTNFTTKFETGFLTHDVSTGLDATREDQYTPSYQSVLASGTAFPGSSILDPNLITDAYNPDPNRPIVVPGRVANGAFSEAEIDTVAVYLFDTIHITERFLINGSMRAERYWITGTSLATPSTTTPVPVLSRVKTSDDLYSWKVGAAYKPLPNGTIYAAYGNSQTPPGTNFAFSATAGNANDPGVEPQEAQNYEIGTKWEFFQGRLSTNLAAFRSLNTNVATNIGTTAIPVIVYDAEQQVDGIELGISGKITKEWLVFGGFSWLDTTNTTSAGAPPAAGSGAELRFTPKYSGNLWTTYALPFHLTIGGGVQYSESVARSTSTTAVPTASTITGVPSYWLVNALVAYEVSKNLTVRLNVNNLLDEQYYRVNNGGARYYPGATRNYVLSADFKF